MGTSAIAPAGPALFRGRLLIVAAAVLWSLSGAFTRLLNHHHDWLRLGPAPVDGLTIAFYRVFFAGLVLVPTLRRGDVSFRPLMLVMVAVFALMNLTFVLAMAGGKSSNAILLQYSAPMWIYLVGVLGLGESASARGWLALLLGMAGVAVIVAGGWTGGDLPVIGLGLASGAGYAGVLLLLRALRGSSSSWLTVLNHLGAAATVAPLLWF